MFKPELLILLIKLNSQSYILLIYAILSSNGMHAASYGDWVDQIGQERGIKIVFIYLLVGCLATSGSLQSLLGVWLAHVYAISWATCARSCSADHMLLPLRYTSSTIGLTLAQPARCPNLPPNLPWLTLPQPYLPRHNLLVPFVRMWGLYPFIPAILQQITGMLLFNGIGLTLSIVRFIHLLPDNLGGKSWLLKTMIGIQFVGFLASFTLL